MILEFVAQQAIGGLIGAGAAHLTKSAAKRLLFAKITLEYRRKSAVFADECTVRNIRAHRATEEPRS